MDPRLAQSLTDLFRFSGVGQYCDVEGTHITQAAAGIVRMKECPTPRIVAAFMRQSLEHEILAPSEGTPISFHAGPVEFRFTHATGPCALLFEKHQFAEGPSLKDVQAVLDQTDQFADFDFMAFVKPNGPLN